MWRIRKVAWVMCVLTTASSMLFANVPVLACACSSVAEQESTAAEIDSPTCCCGSNCCTVTEEEKPCCTTPGATDAIQNTSPDEPAVQAAECQKTVAQPNAQSFNPRESGETDIAHFLLATPDHGQVLAVVHSSAMNWHAYQPPPAPDLVIALQHFLI